MCVAGRSRKGTVSVIRSTRSTVVSSRPVIAGAAARARLAPGAAVLVAATTPPN